MTRPAGLIHGVFGGSMPECEPLLTEMEAWQECGHAVQVVFIPWDQSDAELDRFFEEALSAIWTAGRVPLVTWEPFVSRPETTDSTIDARIAGGAFDEYLDRWTERLRSWLTTDEFEETPARRLYLRFAHEPNGDWYPWAPTNGTTPATYRGMWRHVYEAVANKIPAEQVQWIWAVNHVDVGEVPAEELYPGNDFVDWVGLDGFNWGISQEWSSWQRPSSVFDPMLARLRGLCDKPICIPEVATSSACESGNPVQNKSDWIDAFYRYVRAADIRMTAWFNTDKETDWAVFGGSAGDEVITGRTTRHNAYRSYRDQLATFPTDQLVTDRSRIAEWF